MPDKYYRYVPRTSFMLWIRKEEQLRSVRLRRIIKLYRDLHQKRTMFDALEEMVQTIIDTDPEMELIRKSPLGTLPGPASSNTKISELPSDILLAFRLDGNGETRQEKSGPTDQRSVGREVA